jgi:hypothetical protein
MVEKSVMYEEAVRIPCLMRIPQMKGRNRLVENPGEQMCIRGIMDLSAEGLYPAQQLANMVTEKFGLLRGKPWSARTIRNILKSAK